MKAGYPHLRMGAVALLALAAVLAGGYFYAVSTEDRYIHAFADKLPTLQTLYGSALQASALRQPDLLLVYGSSEMDQEASPYRSHDFFATYPTGFQVFQIARGGVTSLDIAEELATLGPAIKGQKIVISFTPTMFNNRAVGPDAYAGDFSLLHANGLVFSPYLSLDLKRKAAHRLLDYPATLKKDPLLKFALDNLIADTPYHDFLYYVCLPLGELNTLVMRLQDHWAVLTYIWAHPRLQPDVVRRPQVIPWNADLAQAEAEQKMATSNNPYGIENQKWLQKYSHFQVKPPGSSDQKYLDRLQASKEWGDFEILLGVLQQLGAKPLIMSRPTNGTLWAANGISPEARDVYYARLEQLVSAYQMPLVDYKDHATDTLFSIDSSSHTSRKGWVYVDQTLDAFFHNELQ